ncbi:Chemotactic signal-response protein [Sulfitobacter noctilucicola]|uniref:Rod binding domain-containing protein n=1 Tax=Sulfitobacter noctilucicola TaxID=1342301 RepID=A0A7W6Q495_9RHOB|nr:rod-binding protein [Sulfitobacter noctilucicola]KIN63008.1 Chemotactic signal-response protein [Sulfitobacter noctilucicola]MBB4172465.1 Rod binding domain-containing protein [Sulfitobacter noctilucicola]
MTQIQPIGSSLSLPKNESALREAAQQLEASFLAEMLKSAGLGTSRESFGGGAGEDQFASFLVKEHALAMVRAGGIGLSESIYEALKEKDNVGR